MINYQIIEAINNGIGIENAKTGMFGFKIVKQPIIPNIAPDAPKLKLQKLIAIKFAIIPEIKNTSRNFFAPMNFSKIKPNKINAKRL